jgi:pimeloyl-ACP methyl ester carboxylesterase
MRRTTSRWMWLALGGVGATLFFVRLAGAADPAKEARPAPPGKLVDIGGYKLHIWCMGKESESPAVVCFAGSGDFSFTWGLILPEVAKFTRICSYDSAFWAWSDPGPVPRTMKQEAYELHLLLHNAGVKGPYVLVGASGGGLLARVFAREYRDEVVGMVLVDSTDPDTVACRKTPDGKIEDFRVREESKGRPVPPVQTMKSSPPGPLTAEERERIERYRKSLGTPRIYRPNDRLPADLQKLDTWARFHFRPHVAKTRSLFEGEEFQELFEEDQRAEPPLGDMPLIVLIAADKARPVEEQQKRAAADPKRKMFEEKRYQKIAQALWSRNGKYLVVESDHEIHLYQPAWVVEAIRQVVEAVRQKAK